MNNTLNKEVKQNPALLAMLGKQNNEEKETARAEKVSKPKQDWRKKNPRGYERYRGKDGTTKAMSYYLPDDIITLLNIKAAKEGVTKSELVLEGLKYILREEIKEEKAKVKSK